MPFLRILRHSEVAHCSCMSDSNGITPGHIPASTCYTFDVSAISDMHQDAIKVIFPVLGFCSLIGEWQVSSCAFLVDFVILSDHILVWSE